MRKVREVLRLKHQGRSRADIAVAVAIGETTVSDCVARAAAARVTWDVAQPLSDAEVQARLLRDVGRNEPPARAPIDFAWAHRELSRVGVTLQTLWVEYREGAASAAPLKPYASTAASAICTRAGAPSSPCRCGRCTARCSPSFAF